MEKTLIFRSVDEIRLKKLLRFIIPTYLTSLFTTVYTIVDGIFVSAYVEQMHSLRSTLSIRL